MIEYSGSMVSENQEFIQRNINNYIKKIILEETRTLSYTYHALHAIFKQ